MREIKITIDTNLLIYLFDNDSSETDILMSCRLVKAIFDCSGFVKIDTKISTSFVDDISQDTDEIRKKSILMRVQNIFQQESVGKMILIGKEFLPENKEDLNDFEELRRILFPNLSTEDQRYINKINDIRHLFSHLKNRRDIFITNDKNFLNYNKRKAISMAFNTQIKSSDEFCEYVHSFKDLDVYEYKSTPKRLDYVNVNLSGTGELDFTNNNGIYTVGNGDFLFEIKWGECNAEKMRIYNDPKTIHAIAIAEDKKIKEIVSDRYYDFTDRCREMRIKKDVMILKNSKGYFATIRILDFEVKDRGGKRNILQFEYVINTTGNCDFKNII